MSTTPETCVERGIEGKHEYSLTSSPGEIRSGYLPNTLNELFLQKPDAKPHWQ
jgi:hypothetical protein